MVTDVMLNVALVDISVADKMYFLGHYSQGFTPKLFLSCIFVFR